MRTVKAIVVGGAFLSSVVAGHAAAAQPATDSTLRRTCPTTRNLSQANWGGAITPVAVLDTWEAATRGDIPAAKIPADATTVIRSFAGPSETLDEPMDSTATVWRDARGNWFVDKVDFRTKRSVSARPGNVAARTHITGAIDGDDAAKLERLTGDPCLYVEPQAPGTDFIVPDGVWPDDRCYSGAGGIVEVLRQGIRTAFELQCPRLLAGELLRAALYPRRRDEAKKALPISTTFTTVGQSRAKADDYLRDGKLSAEWSNVTSDLTPALLHRLTGLRCRVHGVDGRVFDFLRSEPMRAASCVGSEASAFGDLATLTTFRERGSYALDDAAVRAVPTSYFVVRPDQEAIRKAIETVRIGGSQVATVAVREGPRADARREKYARVYTGLLSDHFVSVSVIGLIAAAHEIDRRAKTEWLWILQQKNDPDTQTVAECRGGTSVGLIPFGHRSADVDAGSRSILSRSIAEAKARAGVQICIEGHADDHADMAADQALSLKRALVVRDALVRSGVERSRIAFTGYGRERPISVENSDRSHAANRRVVVNVQDFDVFK